MGPIIFWAIGALIGLVACDSRPTASSRDADGDGHSEDIGTDSKKDASMNDATRGDRYMDGNRDGGGDGDGGNLRSGINDRYAPLPFCSGRNIFTIKGRTGIGFCGENPTTLYTFPISDDLSPVTAATLSELPATIGGRAVIPTTIRDGGPRKILLPMMNPAADADTAATFLVADISTGTFLGPQVDATGLQIGTFPIGDPIAINGLQDIALIGSEFWSVLSNPNSDGTYGYGFGLALPQTADGLVDTGVPPNMDGIVDRIISNRFDTIFMEAGTHYSFATTNKKPTNVENLGGGLIAIQNSGTSDTPASIDVASDMTHQVLAGRNYSVGMRELTVLPRLAIDASAIKVYPATATSLWEVDLSEGSPAEQENEIPLSANLSGTIAGVVILGGQAVVGDSDGNILFVNLSGPTRGMVTRTIDVGSGLTGIVTDASGNLFAAVQETIEEPTPHIVSINPSLLE